MNIQRAMVKIFVWFYSVAWEDAEKPLEEYPNLRSFFTRRLKPGVRPLGAQDALHPADSRIQEYGLIESGKLIQAKGISYSLDAFTQDSRCQEKWNGGLCVTYYLHPRDYHWVHSPVSGKVLRCDRIPGCLWPVNALAVRWIPKLYVQNARLMVEIETKMGPVGVCLVGAFNVGSISSEVKAGDEISKGQELGCFHLGSTVVVLYPRSWHKTLGMGEALQMEFEKKKGQRVHYGSNWGS